VTCILHLDSSPRGERSISRQLSREFIEGWKRLHPADCVVYRDVGRDPVPHVTEAWVVGAFTPLATRPADAQAAMRISDVLIDEFLTADRYVFGVPMHNFCVPSAFKAYVDQIVRVGRTFSANWKGLALGKKMLILSACGGNYGPGSPMQVFDHQEPWLRMIFGFVGITDISFIHAQGLNMGDESREAGLKHARERIAEVMKSW